jgi:hypothetical protein
VAEPTEVRTTERWFIRQGLPLFVEEYSAGRDVWTRALPILVPLFVLGLLASVASAREVLGALVVLLAVVAGAVGFALVNRSRGRSAFALPRRVGWAWLVAWVVVSPLLALLVERDLRSFATTVAFSLLALLAIYVVTRYALVSMVLWAVRWTFRQISNVTRLITRVLPLMLLFITFLFINTEVWQVAGTMEAWVLWGSLAVFGVIGLLFIVGRSREEFDHIEVADDRGYVVELTQGTPMGPVAGSLDGLEQPVPMQRSQRANLIAVMVTAQAVQVALVGVVVWAFFVLFGSLAISVPVQEAWLGSLTRVEVLINLGDDHGVTRQLLRVATFLGGFAGFYATVYAASDNVYRQHFAARISTTLERAVAVRRAYVALRRREGLPVDVPAERHTTPTRHHDELDD